MSPFFFFNDTATTEIYTLSLHDALPILRSCCASGGARGNRACPPASSPRLPRASEREGRDRHHLGCRPSGRDRKSTRLNSSHLVISYAVFCLKKKMTRLRLVTARRNDGR